VLIRERVAARLRDERGIAMVMAVGITVVLALSTIAMIEFTSAGSRTSSVSRSYVVAQQLAEAGINDAQARLNDAANNATSPTLLTGTAPCPGGGNTCFESTYDGGSTRWFGTYDSATSSWTITSWGLTRNPTDGSLTIQRVLRATTPVVADPTQPNNATAWNYVLSTRASDSTTCDVTVSNNAIVDVNFYVQGNLCLNNNAEILEPDHTRPVELIVHGKLQMSNNANVGRNSSDPVSEAKIGGGCVSSISHAGHLCTTADDFFVGTYTQSPPQINAPVPDYDGWYDAARPGPRYPCNVTAGPAPWPVWDVDTNLDLATGGNAGTFNLTPAQNYTCRYVQNGQTIGELSWVASTRTLTVRGAVYYDGSMIANNGLVNTYDGSGTIYLTGSLTMTNNTMLCGVRNAGSSDCDFESWNPSAEMVIFVANGGGLTNSVTLSNNVHFQGGILARRIVDLSNNVHVEGPMISERYTISNNVVLRPLPTITDLPLGAPGNPNTHAQPQAPRYG
jgi:hypothetical protein